MMGTKSIMEKSGATTTRLGDYWVITSEDPLERTLWLDVEPEAWDRCLTLRDNTGKIVAIYGQHTWKRVEHMDAIDERLKGHSTLPAMAIGTGAVPPAP